MELQSLLYISRSRIDSAEAQDVVQSIVDCAVLCNLSWEITGALLFTGTYFAQVLEGRQSAIDQLMDNLIRDDRHEAIVIVERSPLARRQFASWSLAYFGPSQFVNRHVTRLLNTPPSQQNHQAAEWLTELMREFTAP